jgi:hypothetical protein
MEVCEACGSGYLCETQRSERHQSIEKYSVTYYLWYRERSTNFGAI